MAASSATIWDKNVETFYQFTTFLGYQIYSFPLPPSIQCCQCWFVVKTKLDELQTPWNNIEQGEGGIRFFTCLYVKTCKKICDIHLSRLVLSKIVVVGEIAQREINLTYLKAHSPEPQTNRPSHYSTALPHQNTCQHHGHNFKFSAWGKYNALLDLFVTTT